MIHGEDNLFASHTFWKELASKPEALHFYTFLDWKLSIYQGFEE
jgi:hypothetical protein